MGYSILYQWDYSPPPADLAEIIVTRLLEHYGLSHPSRSSIHFRTFKSSNPSTGKTLTTIGYSQPTAPGSSSLPVPKDDTTYVFLERRAPEPTNAKNPTAPDAHGTDASKTGTGKAESEVVDTGIDVDGFELIDKKDTSATVVDVKRETAPVQPSKVPPGPYSITAVRPSSQLVVLLQNILNPFVMGLTKQARAAASMTAQQPIPAVLPGTSYLISSLHFPPLQSPYPSILLTMHNLGTPSPSTIYLEAEWLGDTKGISSDLIVNTLKEFLQGCLPEGVGGEKRFHQWESETPKDVSLGWEGIERTKRSAFLLARSLRQAGVI